MTTALYVIIGMVVGGALGMLTTALCTTSKRSEQPDATVDALLIERAATVIETLSLLCDRRLDEYAIAAFGRIVADLRALLERIGQSSVKPCAKCGGHGGWMTAVTHPSQPFSQSEAEAKWTACRDCFPDRRAITEDDLEVAYADGYSAACGFPAGEDPAVRQAAKLYATRPAVVSPDPGAEMTSEGIKCA
jgi:hypothetical protein